MSPTPIPTPSLITSPVPLRAIIHSCNSSKILFANLSTGSWLLVSPKTQAFNLLVLIGNAQHRSLMDTTSEQCTTLNSNGHPKLWEEACLNACNNTNQELGFLMYPSSVGNTFASTPEVGSHCDASTTC
jgi:hypothetical protein